MIYLAPNHAPKSRQHFGLLISLNSQRDVEDKHWAMDNGRYSKGGVNPKWEKTAWAKMLDRYQVFVGSCLFCVVPDVPFDAGATLELFWEYLPEVKQRSYPVAIATQNGMKPDDVPWDDIDALFVGGDDKHKLGGEGLALMAEARRRRKWVHVGRVNSAKRIAELWFVDSVDGTTLAIERSLSNIARIQQAVSMAQAKKQMRRLL